MTSTLFGLMYPTTAQRTTNIFTTQYKYLCLIHSGNHVIENNFHSSDRVKEVSAIWTGIDWVHPVWNAYVILLNFIRGYHSKDVPTKCRDGVKVLWCHSIYNVVWLVFDGCSWLSLHALVFVQKAFGLFFFLFRNERRDMGGENKGKMHAWSLKSKSILCCSKV